MLLREDFVYCEAFNLMMKAPKLLILVILTLGGIGFFSVALRITYDSHNIRVYDNIFHHGWQYEGDVAGQRCHAGDWIHMYGNPGSGEYPHDMVFERNVFYNDKEFDYSHGTAFSFMEEGI